MPEQQLDIPALYNIVDLQRICFQQKVRISADTNRYLLYSTLRKLGAVQAQKLIKKLVEKGELKWEDHENFEVEAILDYAKDMDGRELYEIKWKGWSMQHNTWEPRDNLQCPELVEEFHAVYDKYGRDGVRKKLLDIDCDHATKHKKLRHMVDRLMDTQALTAAQLLKMQSPNKRTVKRLQRKVTMQHITNKRSKAYKELKKDQLKRLQEWEENINKINTDPAPITVENTVDLEGPPPTFTYINDYKAMAGIDIPTDPIIGCECVNCIETKKRCCGPNAGAENAYFTNKRVRVPPGHPIYECNKRCACDTSCSNRVVQNGRKHKVCIFRTSNGRGWGVKAMQRVPKGSFVMEYVGEVITFEEAERRGKVYDAEGMTYLFDLDYNDGDCPYTVDAQTYGNVSHFVNHSCDPNLAVYGVWINTLDPRLPRIALFAKKDINKGEELTFDYMMTGAITEESDLQEVDQISEVDCASNKENSVDDDDIQPMDVNLPPAFGTKDNIKESLKVLVRKSVDVSEKSSCEVSATSKMDSNKLLNSVSSNVLKDHKNEATNNNIDDTEKSQKEIKSVNCNFVSEQDTLETLEESSGDILSTPVKASPRMSFSPSPRKVLTTPSPQKITGEEAGSKSAERKLNRRSIHCPPAMKYRLMCQCGAEKCRKYLY